MHSSISRISFARKVLHLALACLLVVASSTARAQNGGGGNGNGNGFFNRAVGGILINANGVISNPSLDDIGELRRLRQEVMLDISKDITAVSPMRKISLRGLEAAIKECVAANKPIPDDIQYLAGMQRIEYVFVYPEQNDIVLAGFGEGWHVDPSGNVVGLTTGRPVLQLTDLMAALRTGLSSANGGISCSIDPTAGGLKNLQDIQGSLNANDFARNTDQVISRIEEAMGPQDITVTGVPDTSHFARVLVAADYRMKRLAMNFEKSPIKKLPDYLGMIKKSNGRGVNNMLPRWYLATNYDPLLTDGEGLAWQLRGQGVKCVAEEDLLNADGTRQRKAGVNPSATKWAENMTKSYDELSVALPIFGELRNCMDLAVVSAMIFKENLQAKAQWEMTLLLDEKGLPLDVYEAPKQVDTKVSFISTKKNFIITASGGVSLNNWQAADTKETSDTLRPLMESARRANADNWWWN